MANDAWLNTLDFGSIRIVPADSIIKHLDEYIGQDIVYEWNYYRLASGEIVAVEND